MILSYKFI